MVARREGVGMMGKRVKGLRNTNWLQNSHRNVKFSIGNIVNNIVVAIYGAR